MTNKRNEVDNAMGRSFRWDLALTVYFLFGEVNPPRHMTSLAPHRIRKLIQISLVSYKKWKTSIWILEAHKFGFTAGGVGINLVQLPRPTTCFVGFSNGEINTFDSIFFNTLLPPTRQVTCPT